MPNYKPVFRPPQKPTPVLEMLLAVLAAGFLVTLFVACIVAVGK